MEPALAILLLALVFTGTHVGLATRTVRTRVVARLGEAGFLLAYSLVASLTFWALVAHYSAHRFDGAPGLALGAVPLVRGALLGVVGIGVVFSVAGLFIPPRLAAFEEPIRPPHGLERITRHPFFTGIALIGMAHVLLATHLAGAVLMGALAILSIAGAWHQDVKFVRRYGRPYGDYLAVTSAIPFAAILGGRQRLVWRELPLGGCALGIVAVFALRLVHEDIFASGGRWMMLAVIGGAAGASCNSWLRSRGSAARAEREDRPVRFDEARGRLGGTGR